ncbi:hypothetical protein WJX79_008450 [Trebouxia sp. C0005]
MISVATAGLILILKDGKPRQEVDLVADQCLSMGKSPSNSIILPDKGIRSEHIKLLVDSQGQALFDSLGHKNVLVNGRLEQGPVQLKDGDLIEVLRKHDGPRQFQQLQSKSGLLLQQDAATQADLPPASQATLEQRLAEKAVEMQILQEQNDRLRAQVSNLQEQLSSLQMAPSVQDAVMAQAADTEELVEPTLVLPSPPKVMPTGPADPSFATTTALYPARHNDTLHVSACSTRAWLAAGLEHSGAGGKAPSKWMAPGGRMGVSVADAPANAAGDETGTAGLPVKKRSRRTISGGKAQQNKENAAANQPAVKKRRQTQCPARAVKKAPMKTQGPRRSTRLADK